VGTLGGVDQDDGGLGDAVRVEVRNSRIVALRKGDEFMACAFDDGEWD
jgi:hypothetical protein